MTKIADKDTLDNRIAECLVLYDEARHDLNIFMNGVADFIAQHPDLTRAGQELVHSHKRRLKDKDHLAEKIRRKAIKGIRIDRNNFFDEMTDLSGVRILHLFQEQFGAIHRVINKRIEDGDWVLGEKPRAYTWDPKVLPSLNLLIWRLLKNQHPIQAYTISLGHESARNIHVKFKCGHCLKRFGGR